MTSGTLVMLDVGVEVAGFEPATSSARARPGVVWRPAMLTEESCWAGALAARWWPVLSLTLGPSVAPMWPCGPSGDHVSVLFLLLGLAGRTVEAWAEEADRAEPDQEYVGAALATAWPSNWARFLWPARGQQVSDPARVQAGRGSALL